MRRWRPCRGPWRWTAGAAGPSSRRGSQHAGWRRITCVSTAGWSGGACGKRARKRSRLTSPLFHRALREPCMDDIVQIENRWYILAGSSLVDQRTLVLKDGETFGAFNPYGDIEAFAAKGQGLFHQDMRFLSRLETRLGGKRPLLLSSAVSTDNSTLMVDLTNPD